MLQLLENGEAIFFDDKLQQTLFNQYKIYSKKIGIDKSTKTLKAFHVTPYLLDQHAVRYLMKNKPQFFDQSVAKEKQELSTADLFYEDTRKQFFLLQGHKFGSDFLAYKNNPQSSHADLLVFCDPDIEEFQSRNQLTRLAEISNKSCLVVCKDDTLLSSKNHLTSVRILQREKLQKEDQGSPKKSNKKHFKYTLKQFKK